MIIKENKPNNYKLMWGELYGIAEEFNFFPLMDKIEQKHLKEAEK